LKVGVGAVSFGEDVIVRHQTLQPGVRQVKKGKDDVRLEYNYYECKNTRQFSEFASCECHAIKREPLEQLVLEDIQRIIKLVKKDESGFVNMMTATEDKERKQSVKKADSELTKAKYRITELNRIINRTYEGIGFVNLLAGLVGWFCCLFFPPL